MEEIKKNKKTLLQEVIEKKDAGFKAAVIDFIKEQSEDLKFAIKKAEHNLSALAIKKEGTVMTGSRNIADAENQLNKCYRNISENTNSIDYWNDIDKARHAIKKAETQAKTELESIEAEIKLATEKLIVIKNNLSIITN